jgi:hypothetical protein
VLIKLYCCHVATGEKLMAQLCNLDVDAKEYGRCFPIPRWKRGLQTLATRRLQVRPPSSASSAEDIEKWAKVVKFAGIRPD